MKSALLSVRLAASAGTSTSPPICSGTEGVTPSHSQPCLITLPKVLTATPRRSSGRGADSRTSQPTADGFRWRPTRSAFVLAATS
jgi:hypothetical protein